MSALPAQSERPSRSALNATMQATSGGAVAFAPSTFEGVLQVAQMMAEAGPAVPKHCRGNVGICLSISMVAYQNGFNPFLLAADTYIVNDILAWGAKGISAMVNNAPRLDGRLSIRLDGAWPKRTCTVSGKIKGDPEVKEWETKAETITTRNSPNWKQQPDQQLAYVAQRNWARIHMSEVTLGLMDSDEVGGISAGHVGPDNARDVTPERPQRSDYTDTNTSHVVDVEPAADPFTFTTRDGECIEAADAALFTDMLVKALEGESTAAIIEGLWETNSGQLDRVREADAKLADEAHDAYGLALDRVHVGAAADPEPASDEAEDIASAIDGIISDMAAAKTVADVEAICQPQRQTIARAKEIAPVAYQRWLAAYNKKTGRA